MAPSPTDWIKGTVLVIGDVMLDRYWQGPTRRISPEAPVPVVRVTRENERVGGAANVAANVAALGGNSLLIGGTGIDDAAQRLSTLCAGIGVAAHFVTSESTETIVKLRVMSQHQQLIRLDFESDEVAYDEAAVRATFSDQLSSADVVVLSDYGKGLLRGSSDLIKVAREAGKLVIVDPKSSDFSRYSGATLVTPNYSEFENCVGPCADDREIVERGESLCAAHDIDNLLITRGELGMILISRQHNPVTLATDARDVFDVTGAGDTVCAVMATALAGGKSISEAVVLANTAAGIAVGKSGTATVSREEIELALSRRSGQAGLGGSIGALLPDIEAARMRGERIVMTNGCFDVLHAGHVTYLEQAKALGAHLLVAINSDASVTRLKGAGRPANSLKDRMTVLAALSSVDWVVSFEEDTPQAVIEAVNPDVLVKGGDYAIEEIVGGEHVRRAGGEVMTLPLVQGLSTTAVIDRLMDPAGASKT